MSADPVADPLRERGSSPEAAASGGKQRPLALSFHARLVVDLVVVALLPLAIFGLVLIAGHFGDPIAVAPLLVFALAITAALGILVGHLMALELAGPLRALARAISRVGAGEHVEPVPVPGDDLLAQLAESHNRLAGDVERRNRQLADILTAVAGLSPGDGVDALLVRAGADARAAFGLIDARMWLVEPDSVPQDERIPGEPLPIRAEIRAGQERLGLLDGRLPATRTWDPADQALLDLFAREVGVAIRNAELFARVEVQNAQLRALAEAKDDFLRGVSHNLQTPLTSIRLYADQLGAATQDRRAEIIVEQADRLSRMVRQLLTVSRLESGTIRPRSEVLALASRVRRAWEGLGVRTTDLEVTDESRGWLAIADGDQLDQVLWALLDNAVKYGASPIEARLGVEPREGRMWLRIADHGPGVAEADRARLFERFARGGETDAADGSGLGLYVARELMRGMQGDLVLEPPDPGSAAIGAAFRLTLPAEPPLET